MKIKHAGEWGCFGLHLRARQYITDFKIGWVHSGGLELPLRPGAQPSAATPRPREGAAPALCQFGKVLYCNFL